MKKILFVLAIAASMQVATAQTKSVSAAKSAVEKAKAATENPKQNTKAATWVNYGKSLVDAYNAPAGAAWLGMSRQELSVLSSNEKPQGEEKVTVGGQQMTKLTYANKNLYFNANDVLAVIEVTDPVVADPLENAVEAYKKAASLDEKGQKTKDISEALETISTKLTDEAYNSYSFGKYGEASKYFEKAAQASATAPLNKVNNDAVYNAAYTAWMGGDNARAKKFFEEGLANGNAGEDGEAYAKLADIAEKSGDTKAQKAYLEQGFEKYPQSQSILVGLINYYISSGEDTQRLFSLLDNAKKNEPTNASLYYVEGNIHEKLGESDAAIAAYKKCAEINPKYAHGYIGLGVHYYNSALAYQDKASQESDDKKYMALMGEFENELKACIEPFEKAYELSDDPDVKRGVAEYLKNACYRFRTSDASYMEKYEKYSAAMNQ